MIFRNEWVEDEEEMNEILEVEIHTYKQRKVS